MITRNLVVLGTMFGSEIVLFEENRRCSGFGSV